MASLPASSSGTSCLQSHERGLSNQPRHTTGVPGFDVLAPIERDPKVFPSDARRHQRLWRITTCGLEKLCFLFGHAGPLLVAQEADASSTESASSAIWCRSTRSRAFALASKTLIVELSYPAVSPHKPNQRSSSASAFCNHRQESRGELPVADDQILVLRLHTV